jgi:hypothetical protein
MPSFKSSEVCWQGLCKFPILFKNIFYLKLSLLNQKRISCVEAMPIFLLEFYYVCLNRWHIRSCFDIGHFITICYAIQVYCHTDPLRCLFYCYPCKRQNFDKFFLNSLQETFEKLAVSDFQQYWSTINLRFYSRNSVTRRFNGTPTSFHKFL